jgi:hypothetical protein
VSDSTATVIGAMIIAPLMTPILGVVLGVVLTDRANLARYLLHRPAEAGSGTTGRIRRPPLAPATAGLRPPGAKTKGRRARPPVPHAYGH